MTSEHAGFKGKCEIFHMRNETAMLNAYSLGINSKDGRLQWRLENFMVFLLDA